MALTKAQISEIVKKFGDNENDTGKVEVQVAILTAEISQLTTHMIANKKDVHSKRGLYIKVSRRKTLLSYLKNKDIERYRTLIKELGLRN